MPQGNFMISYHRDAFVFTILALAIGTIMAILLQHPGYTDAYYYFNAGQRLVQGKGLTDAALWTYIGAPAGLPIPSHLYWMPLTSLIAALGMTISGPTFDGAQIPFVLLYAGLGLIGFTLGALIGKTRRSAWIAGLLTLFSGYFMPYWTTTSTFAPFGFVGALSLLSMGLGRQSGNLRWFTLSGAMAGFAHLTRADGLLLLIVIVIVALWPGMPKQRRWLAALVGVLAYVLIMSPWFIRNLNTVGAILPPGGFQTAWARSYDEIANYPPTISLQDFLAWGPANIMTSRWEALTNNMQRFLAEEGLILLTPFMLIGLWRRRRDGLLSGFCLYVLGLHVVMTFVFTYPGYRGGLFHSASALIPFWAALGVAGLDDVIAWIAPRRHWKLSQAQQIFGTALVIWAILFSIFIFLGKLTEFNSAGGYFQEVAAHLPADAAVMINDPSAMYYFTKHSGIVVPNAPPDTIRHCQREHGWLVHRRKRRSEL